MEVKHTGIYNGHPISVSYWPTKNGREACYDKELFTDLKPEEQRKIIAWISNNIKHRKTPNYRHTSYGLKHIFTRDTGIYVTNNAFKDAMLDCGFEPIDETELNWCYCISQKSNCFKIKQNFYK